MGERLAIPLNVRGELDTANPITDREPGTLVAATDLHPRYWGPREGSKAFTRVWEAPGTAVLYDEITLDGSNTYAVGQTIEDQFRDLGTQFTLDLWFRLTSTAYAAGKTGIGLYSYSANANGIVELSIYGPGSASAGKIKVSITTTPTRSTAASVVTFDSSTAISAGSGQANKYHVRLVRNASVAVLYLNGSNDGSTSSLSATDPIQGTIGSAGYAFLGYSGTIADPTVTFKGQMFAAVLRDGVFNTNPIEADLPCNPWGDNVHHYYLGRDYSLGGANHFFDASSFGMHARISGAGATVSASNDNAFPSNAIVQGIKSWTTRTNRTASAVVAGGVLSTSTIS